MMAHEMRSNGFCGGISNDSKLLKHYSTDESIFSITPKLILQPLNQRDIEKAVKVVSKHTKQFETLALTPRGLGAGQNGGALSDSIVLDTAVHMNKINNVTKVTSENYHVTVEPGARCVNLHQKLSSLKIHIPTLPLNHTTATIGGAVAENRGAGQINKYGTLADWVVSIEVTLSDGNTYNISPLTYKQLNSLIKKDNAYSRIVKSVFKLIEKNESTIKKNRPKHPTCRAGYALWNILDVSVSEFKKGKGSFDLTKIMCGSQGTIGIINSITLKATPVKKLEKTIIVHVSSLTEIPRVVNESITQEVNHIEMFDEKTLRSALASPQIFGQKMQGARYFNTILKLYTFFHVRWKGEPPPYFLLITLDTDKVTGLQDKLLKLFTNKNLTHKPRLLSEPTEVTLFTTLARNWYRLARQSGNKQMPVSILDSLDVPLTKLDSFFTDLENLSKKLKTSFVANLNVNGSALIFYPLLDMTDSKIDKKITITNQEFYKVANKNGAKFTGEMIDGLIHTPDLSKIFSKTFLNLCAKLESTFDPDDIFNPGKKIKPIPTIVNILRTHN